MKTFKAILLAAFVTASVAASAAPLFAAPHSPVYPAAGYIMQGAQPTPTPTPIMPQTDGDECSGGGC